MTTGEAPDGEYLEKLVEQSRKNGVIVEEIAGDTAYSGKNNLEYAKAQKIKLISKLNPVISNGNGQKKEGFVYNKDADTFQCPIGCLAISKAKVDRTKEGKNNKIICYFDIEKCRNCPLKNGCYKDDSKNKTYSVTILSDAHQKQKTFQETEYFNQRAKQRYIIEAKNAELKQAHGLEKADSVGVIAMRLQSYFTAFTANIKRIVKLLNPRTA